MQRIPFVSCTSRDHAQYHELYTPACGKSLYSDPTRVAFDSGQEHKFLGGGDTVESPIKDPPSKGQPPNNGHIAWHQT